MGFFDIFKKKRLSKDERRVLEEARKELKKSKNMREIEDSEEIKKRTFDSPPPTYSELQKQIKDMDKRMEKHFEIEQKKFNKRASGINTKSLDKSDKSCNFCNKDLVFPDINSCYYCKKNYCGEHRLAENHQCPKVMAAKHIEQDYLRKKGVNITTAKFAVVCKSCSYESDYGDIEKVNQIRIDHIKHNHCKSESVKLRQHDENKTEDEGLIQKTYPTNQANTWMYGCLQDAKEVIMNHHNAEGISEFFSESNFSISIQTDMESAYGYVDGTFPNYKIGIHKSLEENTPEAYKMVTVVLIHEILHALHGDWSESQVSNEENRLANLGMHFDAMHNLELLYLSGKMRLCAD